MSVVKRLNFGELLDVRDIRQRKLTDACIALKEVEDEIALRLAEGTTDEDRGLPIPPPNAVWR